MIINVWFQRRKPGRARRKYENKNVAGIHVEGEWENHDGPTVRKELQKHAPEGDGWSIQVYALVKDGQDG